MAVPGLASPDDVMGAITAPASEKRHRAPGHHVAPQANVAFTYSHSAPSADEALLRLLMTAPPEWLHDAYTYQGRIWQGWTESYQQVAGKVVPPIWL